MRLRLLPLLLSLTSMAGAQTAAAPTFTPTGGAYPSPPSITMTHPTAGALIFYTKDGSTPDTSSFLYNAPVSIDSSATIRALAVAPGINDINNHTDTRRVSFEEGWKICTATTVDGSSQCGGVGSITPSAIALKNRQSPSLNNPPTAIQYSMSTTTSSSFTDSLVVHNAGACDSCTYALAEFDVWIVPSRLKNNHEFDQFIFDRTRHLNFMFGKQCDGASGHWQIANQKSAWQDVRVNGQPVSCVSGPYALPSGQWVHIQFGDHRVLGDTSCIDSWDGNTPSPCQYDDFIKINGKELRWNQKISATVLSSGWSSQTGYQFQIDTPGTGATFTTPVTVSEFIDNSTFRAMHEPSPVAAATYTIGAPITAASGSSAAQARSSSPQP